MNSSPASANAASAVHVLSVEVFVKIVDSVFVYGSECEIEFEIENILERGFVKQW